ncbi:MAG: DUF1538 domain-containing protein [Gammaproteobacteria bacterium]|nr:MAG: DUF1538 domain-containing protein [Gammaproteobacteria bacterium]
MAREIRFGSFVREITVHQVQVSYNELAPKVELDENGSELPYRPGKLKLRPIDVYNVVRPYVSVRLLDQVKAVVPLAIYLMLFQMFILRQDVTDSWVITAGLVAVIVGLMLFMEGLKVGLMPFGETIGNTLPTKSPLPVVLLIAFLLGIGVTFAEPAIGALKAAGSLVQVESAPLLYTLLNDWSEVLVLVVGIGVGLAAVIGTLRFLYGWSLKPLIYLTLIPTIGLAIVMSAEAETRVALGLAWDCGAVTTGPVTVPLVLSLGIGIASAAGKGSSTLSGFGVVTLASLFPVLGVEALALYVAQVTTPEGIIAAAAAAAQETQTIPWYERTPGMEIISGVRAIVPLVIFLLLVMHFVLREPIRNPGMMTYGIILAVLGMIIFSLGLSYGLAKLGGQSGGLVPAAFAQIDVVAESPLYRFSVGIFIAVMFAWLLGFGATLAEPALNALGMTVESLTNGAFRKSTLMYAVALGVAFGIGLGVLKIIFSIDLAYLLVPGYVIAAILTFLSSEEFVNVAWDSAGVTTGPVTVPLVLAMGLGFGNAVGAIEGFGILSMASIGPIIAVLTTGLWIQWKIKRRHAAEEKSIEEAAVAAN